MYNVSLEALGRPSFGYQTTDEIILNLVQKGFIERDTVEYTYNMMANESMHHTGPTKIMTLSYSPLFLCTLLFMYNKHRTFCAINYLSSYTCKSHYWRSDLATSHYYEINVHIFRQVQYFINWFFSC